ncbi:MAG: hypothetical protein DLM70_15320, partial [Chloroflexi bacterium]
MKPVRRVVIRDKHPVFERELIELRPNRAVLAVATFALLVQIFAVTQAAMALGNRVGWFEHVLWSGVACLWLALGILVFLQRRAHHAGRLFLLCSSAGAIWLGMGTFSGVNMVDALLYSAGYLLFPPLLYAFSEAYTEQRPWRHRDLLFYVPPLVLIWPMAHDYVAGPKSLLWRLAIILAPLYLVAAMARTARDMYGATAPERQAQLRALLFGLVAGTVPAIFTFGIPLVLYSTPPIPTGWLPLLVLLFLVAMSYAVLLFEFSEADLIVRRGVVYGVLTMGILAVYGLLGVVLAASGASVQNPGGALAFVGATIVIGSAFTPIRRSTRRLVDWLLYGQRRDRWHALQAFSERLATVMQPEDLGEVVTREMVTTLHLRGAFVLWRTPDGAYELRNRSVVQTARRNPLPETLSLEPQLVEAALGSPTAPLLLIHARPLTAARRESVPHDYRTLDSFGVALAIPLQTRFSLEAVLCLQGKQAHDAIDGDDLELLAPVIRQASAALDNALLFARLQEKVEEVRHAYVRIAREQEAERGRLARELHDGTAQELANLITLATVAERQMNGHGASHETLDRLRRQAEDAYQGVRRASYALRPVMLDDFGLEPTLGRFLEGFRDATGIGVEYAHSVAVPLTDDVELALFRVAQECMENVRKHSHALRVEVELRHEDGAVTLTVQDDGHGMSEQARRGIGLAGMRERIDAVGGDIRVETALDHGVR